MPKFKVFFLHYLTTFCTSIHYKHNVAEATKNLGIMESISKCLTINSMLFIKNTLF